ncbi:MAG: glycosyltransferase family 9 protein [Betaproteobacteria bacterium]|nr:glycosyltransferase family 9 protein [Betaproteobacteria bacterium]
MIAPPRSVLVVVTRRIGDVLLATPLIRSIKQGWPDTKIDVLVFDGTQGILAGNPDIREVRVVAERPEWLSHLGFLARLWRRYDVALSLLAGDRPTLYAWIAGRWRAGTLVDAANQRWKQHLLSRWVAFDDLNTHTVRMHLALTRELGIAPLGEVNVSWRPEDAQSVERALAGNARPLAVLHAYPKFNYKMWRPDAWIAVAQWLDQRGFRIVLSGGADAVEQEYVGTLARQMPSGTINVAGKLSLGGSGCLASRASLYVGTDTAMTHIAAAAGVPTVALFGPSNPVKWGPWPKGQPVDVNPWRRCGSQRAGNVALLQGAEPCVPCLLEGCERNTASFSDCLQRLPPKNVIAAIEAVTAQRY